MSSKQIITFNNDGNYIFNGKTFTNESLANLIANGSFFQMIKNSENNEIEINRLDHSNVDNKPVFCTALKVDKPYNLIVFGAPGTGKSYKLDLLRKELLKGKGEFERVTFHPDYSYSNFVGTYKPTMVNTSYQQLNPDEQLVISTLINDNISTQEKYDVLYDRFDPQYPECLELLLQIYTDGKFEKRNSTDNFEKDERDRVIMKKIRRYVEPYSNSYTTQDEISYRFVPGPFMRMYVKSLKNAQTSTPAPCLLIIEEINRANVAAVFGDIFQLLDRDNNNVSQYSIEASEDIKKYLVRELGGCPDDYSELRIPNNMFIWATMNSADQGVFPMDTAFKRRWNFMNIDIDAGEKKIKGLKVRLGKGDSQHIIEWNELRKAINRKLSALKLNEDKLIGPFFLPPQDLKRGDDGLLDKETFVELFKNKVIMYLFEDAVRQKRSKLFSMGNSLGDLRYSSICNVFDEKGIEVFQPDIYLDLERQSEI